MSKSNRRGWNVRLHMLVINYNFDKRIPKKVEEPRCRLEDASSSHIIAQ